MRPHRRKLRLQHAHLRLPDAGPPAHWQSFSRAKVGGNEVVDAEANVFRTESPAHVGGIEQPVGGNLRGGIGVRWNRVAVVMLEILPDRA
jgi:hypothetical protein